MSNIEDAIRQIQGAVTKEEAFEKYNQAMSSYGYNNNCYTLMNDHNSIGQSAFHGLATSYPTDWINYYSEKNYQEVDAIWDRLLERPTPFFWKDVIEFQKNNNAVDETKVKAAELVMHEAEDAGVADGIGISFVNTMGEIAGIGLSRDRTENQNNYANMAEVYLISTVFHDKYMSLYTKPKIPEFTKREREILLWAAEGKTDWEIGEILTISVPTVRFHWKNIFEKTDVNSKVYAITVAIRYGAISPHLIRTPYQK